MSLDSTTTYRKSYDDSWLREVLCSLGYKLQDMGNHWRTSAIYRGGQNKNTLAIYKKTGVWVDYAEGENFKSFDKLIFLSTDVDNYKKIIAGGTYVESKNLGSYKLTMEKTYPDSALSRLLPHYDFYTKRGVSVQTLKALRGGYATGSKMFQRFVFPITNKDGKIHGFSGRHVFWRNGDETPKWKHIGETKNWVYPYFVPNYQDCAREIEEKREVRIVESVGDCIACMEAGQHNVLVCFGLVIKTGLLAFLQSLDLDRVIVSLNNDENGNGQFGAAKQALKLLKYYDLDMVAVELPEKGDWFDVYSNKKMLVPSISLQGSEMVEWCKQILGDKATQEETKIINKCLI